MKTTLLKQQYLDAIRRDGDLLSAVAKAAGRRSVYTIQTWLRENSQLLTMQAVQDEIRRFMGLSREVELTEQVEVDTTQDA